LTFSFILRSPKPSQTKKMPPKKAATKKTATAKNVSTVNRATKVAAQYLVAKYTNDTTRDRIEAPPENQQWAEMAAMTISELILGITPSTHPSIRDRKLNKVGDKLVKYALNVCNGILRDNVKKEDVADDVTTIVSTSTNTIADVGTVLNDNMNFLVTLN
ncbi:MAG: hypothetical protein ACI8UO_003054, partial [Verrucomicrobiales bacterium]